MQEEAIYLEFLDPKLDENNKFLFNYIKRLKKDKIGIEALSSNGKILGVSQYAGADCGI